MLTADELGALPEIFVWLAWAVYALGGLICVMNFRIFVDWRLHCMRKPPKEPYRHVSAIPVIGSLLVALMLRALGSIPAAKMAGIVLILIDTGGIPWILAGIPFAIYRHLKDRKRKE